MPNNKYVAKDCLVYLLPASDPNWVLSPTSVDYANIFSNGDAAKFYARNLTLEATTETVDVTGIAQGIISNADGKFDVRVNMSKLVPIAGSGIANFKSVPKDVKLTVNVYPSPTFRTDLSGLTPVTLYLEGYARSINLSFSIENVRVDGFGDDYMYRRPTRLNGRCRIEGLLPLRVVASDENFIFLLNELLNKRVVSVVVEIPVDATRSYFFNFTGGVARTNVNVDNPMRQDLELTSIGFLPETSYTTPTSYRDPVTELFRIVSGAYSSLAFGVGIVLPGGWGGITTNRRFAGYFGVEELSLNVTEGDVTTDLSGVLYNTGVVSGNPVDIYTDAV